ncbi:MAG: hypothetical protein LUQ31_11245 [Methanoregula sp.]|nr:hypothetical protein [Methanoregula sp.]
MPVSLNLSGFKIPLNLSSGLKTSHSQTFKTIFSGQTAVDFSLDTGTGAPPVYYHFTRNSPSVTGEDFSNFVFTFPASGLHVTAENGTFEKISDPAGYYQDLWVRSRDNPDMAWQILGLSAEAAEPEALSKAVGIKVGMYKKDPAVINVIHSAESQIREYLKTRGFYTINLDTSPLSFKIDDQEIHGSLESIKVTPGKHTLGMFANNEPVGYREINIGPGEHSHVTVPLDFGRPAKKPLFSHSSWRDRIPDLPPGPFPGHMIVTVIAIFACMIFAVVLASATTANGSDFPGNGTSVSAMPVISGVQASPVQDTKSVHSVTATAAKTTSLTKTPSPSPTMGKYVVPDGSIKEIKLPFTSAVSLLNGGSAVYQVESQPPLTIVYTVTPRYVTDNKCYSVGTDWTCKDMTYPDPASWLTVRVKNSAGSVLYEGGFNREYPSDTSKVSKTIYRNGPYTIEINGTGVNLDLSVS